MFITAPTSPTADLASNVSELGSSLPVESQQSSSVVTESDVLEKDLAMEDERDHFREQAGASGKRDTILRILRYIEDGAGNNTHSQHKRHVIVLGLTGSGKSTTINSLAGCKLRRVTEEEADRFELSRDALVVASGDQRGGRKEATKIGNRFGKSQTEVLQSVAVDENDDDAVAIFFLLLIMSKTVFLESKQG
jgi:ribose 5-phosphate isomerase RpiB